VKAVYQIAQQSQHECEDLENGGLDGWKKEEELKQRKFEGYAYKY
jgi:hypothetical protein